jgi:5-methyltetrahydropteroyltriglutamate--homocysteine methyltransferase
MGERPMSKSASRRPPFAADHVGSLLRPVALRNAFRRHAAGEIDDVEFTRIQDQCIRDVVGLQEETGLQVVTDGEFRRGSYWGRFVERMEGFEIREAGFKFRNEEGHEVAFTAPYANSKIKRTQALALDEFRYLREATRVTPKITLPAPSTMHFYRPSDFAPMQVYADAEIFLADLANVYQQEIAELVAAGCRYVQLDEVAIALLCDPSICAQVEAAGHKPTHLVAMYVDAINQAIAGCSADISIGVHMCRGNFKGHYLGEGGYESVAERFFSATQVTHFLLEYDTPRAGDFKPLRFVPKNKGVVLGLISSKKAVLESIDELKRRVDEASRYIPIDCLAISPQCGFASTVAGNPLTEDDERKKLALAVQAAQEIWA